MTRETVVGWDGSASAERALDWALDRAEAQGESVLIVRVIPDAPDEQPVGETVIAETERALDERFRTVRDHHPRLTIASRLLLGDPVNELLSLSDENTLIVVGTDSPSASDMTAAWSFGARLAATSYGPVAVIPEVTDQRRDPRLGILAGVDGSAASLEAARFAASEATRTENVLTVVHAWQVPPMWTDSQLDEESLHALEEVHRGILSTSVDQLQREFPTLRIERTIVNQPAMTALSEASHHSRLLVLGNHGLKAAPRLALGPISHSLVRDVHVPTVIVRVQEGVR